MKCLKAAAEAGIVEAQYRLAVEYYQKEWHFGPLKPPQNLAAAREWALAASEQRHYKAARLLSMMYVAGDGVQKDLDAAEYYYDLGRAGPLDLDWSQWYIKRRSAGLDELRKEREKK